MSQDKKVLPAGAIREILENKADVSLVKMTVKAGTKPPFHTHPANIEHGFLLSETDQEFLEIFVPGRQDL